MIISIIILCFRKPPSELNSLLGNQDMLPCAYVIYVLYFEEGIALDKIPNKSIIRNFHIPHYKLKSFYLCLMEKGDWNNEKTILKDVRDFMASEKKNKRGTPASSLRSKFYLVVNCDLTFFYF